MSGEDCGVLLPSGMGADVSGLKASRLWRKENVLIVPSTTQSVEDSGYRDVQFSRPLGARHRATIESKYPVASLIIGLLLVGGPADIPRFVVPVGVDAIKGVLGARTRPYVVDKRGEVTPPFIADNDSTATVESIPGVIGVVTPRPHLDPSPMLWCSCASMNTMAAGSNHLLSLQASAGFRDATVERFFKNVALNTAIAAAEDPLSAMRSDWFAERGPSSEATANHQGNFTVKSPEFVLSRGRVSAAEHEWQDGYFSIGGLTVVMPRGAVALLRAKDFDGKDAELRLREIPQRTPERLK